MSSRDAANAESLTTGRRNEWTERSARLYAELEGASRALVRRAYRGAFGEDELDDIYSNAWLGTLRALGPRHTELTDDEVRSYLFAAVAHQASREIRRRRRKPTAPLEAVVSRADAGPTPDERAAIQESSRVTRDLLASLPPRRRAVMLLRYGWGLDPQQVCSLVRGLSARAYRKEVTRGVNELAEKMRTFERGDWCANREPVLKAYAAGIANGEEARQAEAHLAHCRPCKTFVARLAGHMHDIGAAVLAPPALDALHVDVSWIDRIAEVAERARGGLASALGRSHGGGSEDAIAAIASSGGVRGAGAAGAGVLAKLAGAGAAAKLAAACAGGMAASACIAAGVGTIEIPGEDDGHERNPIEAHGSHVADEGPPLPAPDALPSQIDVTPSVEVTAPAGQEHARPPSGSTEVSDTQPGESPEADLDSAAKPDVPAPVQEFGLEAAAAPSTPPPIQSNDDGGQLGGEGIASGSDVKQQFGP